MSIHMAPLIAGQCSSVHFPFQQGVGEECTIRTNSPKLGDDTCGQCVGGGVVQEERKEGGGRLVVKAGQAGTELRSVGLAGGGQQHLNCGAAYQAKFNITVALLRI